MKKIDFKIPFGDANAFGEAIKIDVKENQMVLVVGVKDHHPEPLDFLHSHQLYKEKIKEWFEEGYREIWGYLVDANTLFDIAEKK